MKTIMMVTVKALALLALTSALAWATPTRAADTSASTMASSAPAEVPLMSAAKLQTYAFSQVRYVEGYAWSPSMAGTNGFFVGYTNADADPGKMASLVKSQEMLLSVDPADTIQNSAYYDSAYYPMSGGYSQSFVLFYGKTNFVLQYSNGVYVVPTNAYDVGIKMNDWNPFPVKGVSSAYIYTKDANGNVTGYYNFADDYRIDTANGLLFLSMNMTSLTGSLYLGFNDGSRAIYDLGTGQKVTIATVPLAGPNVSVEGLRTLPDNTTNVVYQAGDKVISIAYTMNVAVSMTFPPGLSEYPILVHGTDSQDLWVSPLTDGIIWNPIIAQPVFKGMAGRTLIIWFDYPDDGQLPNSGGGGGGGVKGKEISAEPIN